MKEQCDEILKQYGISRCTDFSFPLKSEQPVLVKPPTHPNPNVVRICKSIRNIGRSLRFLMAGIILVDGKLNNLFLIPGA